MLNFKSTLGAVSAAVLAFTITSANAREGNQISIVIHIHIWIYLFLFDLYNLLTFCTYVFSIGISFWFILDRDDDDELLHEKLKV